MSPGGQSNQPPTTPTTGSVTGTSGDNRLTGTSGNDVFKGNGGHDTFAFAANFGNDIITDFGAGRRSHDIVEFSRTVFDDFADVLAHASQNGQDVVIDAGGGNSLTFKNTSLSSLDRSDFHFV
jgi:Ca2+-binding RTX toxin-like protein